MTKDWVDILAALSTPNIGIAVVVIAFMQWRTAELKRRHELFDRRYAVYEKVGKFLLEINQKMQQILPETEVLFIEQFGPSRFLFGDDIRAYLDELWNQYNMLRRHQHDEKYLGIADYFNEQFSKTAEEKFSKYLKIERNFWKVMIMNWRRGLCRVWIVASVFWFVGMGWYQYAHNVELYLQACSRPLGSSATECIVDTETTNHIHTVWWLKAISFTFLPPFGVLIAFMVGRWIKRGFRAEKK